MQILQKRYFSTVHRCTVCRFIIEKSEKCVGGGGGEGEDRRRSANDRMDVMLVPWPDGWLVGRLVGWMDG